MAGGLVAWSTRGVDIQLTSSAQELDLVTVLDAYTYRLQSTDTIEEAEAAKGLTYWHGCRYWDLHQNDQGLMNGVESA